MKFGIRITNDPEFNDRHRDVIHGMNEALYNSIHRLFDEGMPIKNIVQAVPVSGVTEEDIVEVLEGFWFDSRARIRREDLSIGLRGEWVTGPGVVTRIGRDTFGIRYDKTGRTYAYDYETLDQHICVLPHIYLRVDGVWHHNSA